MQKTGSGTGSEASPGTVPGPAMGPTAGAGPSSAAPFMGLYDSAPAPAATSKPSPAGGQPDPHVTLFAGITETQDSAKEHAGAIGPDTGYYAGYDTAKSGGNPQNQIADMAVDAAAVLLYSKVGNQVDLVPARDSKGNIQYDANGNVKYDIDYGLLAGVDMPILGQTYQSAKELGQSGANAVLNSDGGHPPAKGEPIVIDAHSGGGQTAFFTALELYQKGYTDINVVGFDMAMTPEQRATLEKLGVDVSNATSHVKTDTISVMSPMAAVIQLAMGGANPQNIGSYYDTTVQLSPGDLNNQNGVIDTVSEWHGFKDNDLSLYYMQQQNVNQSENGPAKARPDFFAADVNAKDKSASIDIGGPKGLGAYVNLSEGQLDLNVFGKHVDIDQSFRNAGKTVTRAVDKAKELGSDAKEWVQDKAESATHWVQDKAQSASHWVQDKVQAADTWVQDKAQTASNWVQDKTQSATNWVQDKTQTATNWVQDKTQSAGSWLQDTTSAVGNWLFGGTPTTGSKGGQAMSPGSATGSKGGQAMSAGPLGGAKAGAGASSGQLAGKAGSGAKPSASKSATGSGTVVSAPKDSPGTAAHSAASGASKTGSAGKAADDVVRPTSPSSGTAGGVSGGLGGKAATQVRPGSDSAPKSAPAPSASPSKPGSATQPKAPSSPSPGKAADDVAPKSSSSGSSSKPAKTSSKALDDVAPKSSAGGSRDKEDRYRFR